MDFITRIGTVSNVSYDVKKEQLSFIVKNDIGQSVCVESTKKKLNEETKDLIKNGDKVTVVGTSTEKQFFIEENDIVIQAMVVIIDNIVYPSDFPLYVALQYRNDELQRMEIVKADLETAEPDDPF